MTDIYKMLDGKKVKLSAKEIKLKEEFDELANQDISNFKEQEETKQAKKTSGKQKLKDLGLDDDEIQALMGV